MGSRFFFLRHEVGSGLLGPVIKEPMGGRGEGRTLIMGECDQINTVHMYEFNHGRM